MRFVTSVLFLLTIAQADANPYSSIAARNIFGLIDPPPPVVVHQPPPAKPAPKLVLSGVADFSTAKWAFVTRTDPGRPPKNYTLTLGESEGGLQLIDLDAKTATVLLRVDGFDTVSLKLTAATNPPVQPPRASQLSGLRTLPPRLR